MGDRQRHLRKRRVKQRPSWHGKTCHGDWEGRMLFRSPRKIVLIAENRWRRTGIQTWVMWDWEYKSLLENIGGELMSRWLKKVAESKPEADPKNYAEDPEFAEDFPALSEFLLIRKMDDGTVRQGASLLIFAEDGVWKACLNDRAEERTLWCSGSTFADLLDALEAMLQSDSPQWRKPGPRKAKK